jgi:hypothetical protein
MNRLQYCIRRTGLEARSSGRSLITNEQREEPGMKSTYRELTATHGLAFNDTIITSGCELAMRQMFDHLSGASFRKRGPRPHAADHGMRGASAERALKATGLFRAIRIVARVRIRDATRPVPEVPSVALNTDHVSGSTGSTT